MAHQVIDMKCPGCGAPTSTGETTCKYCHRPVIISTFNSVYSMPLPEVNKYAGAYRKALSENPDSIHDDPPDLSLADLAQQLLKLRPIRIFTGIAFVLEYPAAPTFQFILAKVNLTFNADTVLAVY